MTEKTAAWVNRHPKIARLLRQGGLFVVVSNAITVFKALALMVLPVGEVVNFVVQRRFVFRSEGNPVYQGLWYALTFCVVTCVVNSVNCVWVEVVSVLLPAQLRWLHSIGTTVLNGGISMVIFFAVNKAVFKSPD